MKAALIRLAPPLALLAGLASTPAAAANYGVGLNAGTLGLGADFAYGFTESINGRVGFNTFSISEDFEDDDIEYSADLELESFHVLGDWHVLGGGFRLTGGVIFNNNAFEGDADIDAGDRIGNGIAVSDGQLSLDVTYDDAAPYLGVGWGNRVRGWSKVSFSLDAGVMLQGTPTVDIDDSGTTGVSQSDLEDEEDDVEEELEDFEVYPVLSASLIFRF